MAHGLTMTNTSLVPSQFSFFVAWEQGYVVHHIWCLSGQVNSILRNVASKLDYDNDQLESLYERTAWKLEEKTGIPGSAYELFKKAVV